METATGTTNNMATSLIAEMTQEAATTRKVLERIPETLFDYKPHEKSMTMQRLATHVAEMFGWTNVSIEKPGLDFAVEPYAPFEPKTNADLVDYFDKTVAGALESLKNCSDAKFMESWTMRNGEQVYFTMPKIAVMRTFVMNHIIHHRGQLSVYLRLNDIPVPSIYGPSADEGQM
jgi:uncharacterized damage-inducible protein DinB